MQRKNDNPVYRRVNLRCWIGTGHDQTPLRCRIFEIADGWAKLECDLSSQIPNEFFLLLGPISGVGRKCRVAKRDGSEMLLEFLSKAALQPREIVALKS